MSPNNGEKKTRTTVNVSAAAVKEARVKNINLSALVDDLLVGYFRAESATEARIRAKRERLLQEREHIEVELAQIEEELEEVDRQLDHYRRDREEQHDALYDLAGRLPAQLDPENLAIQNQAPEFDMTPRELVEAIEKLREEEDIRGYR
jgi:chromosome segregation ATPase